jgi:hypothetical protein
LNIWIKTVCAQFPTLSMPQASMLAQWSFGMVMTRSCGQTTVAAFLAELLGQKEAAVRQRLREWYWAAQDKQGQHRQTLEVEVCFPDLLHWVLSWWPATERRLALALDATTLKDQFVALVISVVYRGSAIPVAWAVLPACQKGAWKPHWLRLLALLRRGIPSEWCVIVVADRGLYARWLYQAIIDNHWHPFLRINVGGKYQLQDSKEWRSLQTVISKEGQRWCGRVVCFRSQQLPCTLLARWDEGYEEPWLVVTDLTPEQADVVWYGLRAWIEHGFKQIKRGGWQWQYTRMTDPHRVARFWLAIAVATLWALGVGGEADETLPASMLDELPETHIARQRTTHRSRPRPLSCFRRGIGVIIAALINGNPLPLGRFCPEPWPSTISLVNVPLNISELNSS